MSARENEVPADLLRWKCHPESLTFETTDELEPTHEIVGQPTAYEALKFGIKCLAPGQNVYVRGARGTGRITMVRQLLNELNPQCGTKRDFCYVHNFSRPDHPSLITLPPGAAGSFRREMSRVVEFFEEGLTQALESEPHLSNRHAVQARVQEMIRRATEPLEKEIESSGMALVSVQKGPASQTLILPVVDGKPIPPEQLRSLVLQGDVPEAQLKAFEDALPPHQKKLQEIGRAVNEIIREASREVFELNEKVARNLSEEFTAPLLKQFPIPAVKTFIREVIDDMVENHLQSGREEQLDLKELYGVNIVLSHEDASSRPVVEENSPSLINLLGTVEPEFGPGGMAISDYRGVRAGAILQADSGYLILDVNEMISEPGAWRALMRTLRTGRLEIVPSELGWMRQTVLTQPEPIEIQVRVILIGDAKTYYQLDHADPDFRELFKVLADFDNELSRDKTGVRQYGSVVAGLAQAESLPAFHRSAVAALTEHGARIVARKNRLSAKFGRIADIAREAAFLADGETVSGEHVKSAIRRTKDRASLPSRKFREMVENQTLMVQTDGDVVGQINGLAVMRSGPLTYGFPARITATIGPGSAGLINIEGRAQMSGAIHTKGFHILGGLLRYLLRTEHPMAFSASLAFEQSYGGIDGDSASGAEIVCLLSALTGIPIKQSMAMTGAIDQHGHLEAIGGANEKIEGFFDACNYFGLTGKQGVVIPKSNAGDLMLREDIVEAVREKRFYIYAVDNIYDAIELMTGEEAGQPDEDDKYPAGTLLAKAHDEIEKFWRLTLASPLRMTQVETQDANDDAQPMIPSTDDPRSES
ncbi:MAG: putative ATP-dependent protease [Mariniblastus sp.]|jgi:predicted ATP-dependent protease